MKHKHKWNLIHKEPVTLIRLITIWRYIYACRCGHVRWGYWIDDPHKIPESRPLEDSEDN